MHGGREEDVGKRDALEKKLTERLLMMAPSLRFYFLIWTLLLF